MMHWRVSRGLAFNNQKRTNPMKNQGWTRRLFAVALITSAAAITFAGAQAQDNTIAKSKARGKLLAGVKFDTPPFGFLDDKNQPVGFDIDLMRKIAEHIGVPVELVSVTSPTRIPMLVSGNVDLVAASMTHTRERDKTIDFSITYYTGGQSLLVPKSSSVAGLRDLDGRAEGEGHCLQGLQQRVARPCTGACRCAHGQREHPAGIRQEQ